MGISKNPVTWNSGTQKSIGYKHDCCEILDFLDAPLLYIVVNGATLLYFAQSDVRLCSDSNL